MSNRINRVKKTEDLLRDILYFTNSQKALSFFLEHIGDEYYDRQVAKLTGLSRAGTNFALRDLAKCGLLERNKKGRMVFYRIKKNDILVKHLKIVQNIVFLTPLLNLLIPESLQIVLFGSAAKGENTTGSDIDLFILTRNTQEIKNIIFKNKLRHRLQPIINTLNELAALKKENPVFFQSINEGIVLWEEKRT